MGETPAIHAEGLDGMSIEEIESLVEALEAEVPGDAVVYAEWT